MPPTLFPVRHFTEIISELALWGLRLCLDLDELRCAALLLLPALLMLPRLKKAIVNEEMWRHLRLLKKKYEYEGNICYTR